jgi:hypothetical protein
MCNCKEKFQYYKILDLAKRYSIQFKVNVIIYKTGNIYNFDEYNFIIKNIQQEQIIEIIEWKNLVK